MSSLIQQRMSIDREHIAGLWMLIGGSTMAVVGVGLAYWQTSPIAAASAAVFGAVVGIGLRTGRSARRRRAVFEEEHGVDAGKQDWVR